LRPNFSTARHKLTPPKSARRFLHCPDFRNTLQCSQNRYTREARLPELKLYTRTYYGNVPEEVTEARRLQEYDSPDLPVVVRPADGVRVVLGTHDFWDTNFPDIQI